MLSTRWHTTPLPYDKSKELAEAIGVSEILATVLARRGYTDPEAARLFLDGEGELHDPFLFPDMAVVRDRLRRAISAREKICIHGDYDVDGVTATALLAEVLGGMGAEVVTHLPNRFSEGYGISPEAVRRIAADGTTLLIAVDCGIGAREQMQLAGSMGVDTVVIDHHLPVQNRLPPGPVISPLLCDYPFKELAGVGLAFKVAQGLMDQAGGGLPQPLRRQLDLVALGTIADVVPLVGENRNLVKQGLTQMSRGGRPGLKALMDIAQIEPLKLNARQVAYRLAPRLNAAGRLEDPAAALELLLATNETAAAGPAVHLDSLNQERQRIENQMLAQAQEMVSAWPEALKNAGGYVLSSPGWHEGVIGIVASRMVELHQRPVILISEGTEQGKGSGRSVPGFDLHQALKALQNLFKSFGGHSAACGLTIESGRIEDLRREFASYAGAAIAGTGLARRRHVDALVTGRELTLGLAAELAHLEPFGPGNPSVELLAPGARLRHGRATRNGLHLQCQVESGGVSSSAIGFRQAYMLDKINSHPQWDVVFRLEENEFNGSVTPQLNLRELIPRPEPEQEPEGLCRSSCDYGCPRRVAGPEFWDLLKKYPGDYAFLEHRLGHGNTGAPNSDSGAGSAGPGAGGLAERLIDRRNFGGIPGQIARLATTGQSILLLTADVPRRRHLVSQTLPLANLNLGGALMAGSRCSRRERSSLFSGLSPGSPTLLLTDFSTALGCGAVNRFAHIVFVDPPPHPAVLPALAKSAPESWLHLFYCSDEVQFTRKVLEHEYDLRAPLVKTYKLLRPEGVHPFNEATERLLLAGGKYLRQPALVTRCLRVLEELGLASIEDGSGEPALVLTEGDKTELNRSPAFRAVQSFYEECQKFLNKSLNVKLV